MPIIAVFNQKGGVGKTTTALNLAAALALRDYRPLAIDLDPQAHLTAICGATPHDSVHSIYGFYCHARPLSSIIHFSPGGWRIIPSHVELSKVDTQFGKGPNVLNRLNTGIVSEKLAHAADPVLIDCCPVLGVLSMSAIFACDWLLVPISADYLALQGVLQVEKTLSALEHVLKLRVPRNYVLTRFDARRKLSWEIFDRLRSRFGAELCDTRISENVSLAESPAKNMDVFSHAPRSRGAEDYAALTQELQAKGWLRERDGISQEE